MEKKRRLVDRVIDAEYSDGLEGRSLPDLRTMRAECRDADNELSFERRLCQARLDILSAELENRTAGGERSLVDRLPEILGRGEPRGEGGPLPSRAPDFSAPRNADAPRRRIEDIVGEQTLARLPEHSEEEIRAFVASLQEHERAVSQRRKSIHEVLDRIQEEIVRRFVSGEADPAAALGSVPKP
jgi:hypothetical protein